LSTGARIDITLESRAIRPHLANLGQIKDGVLRGTLMRAERLTREAPSTARAAAPCGAVAAHLTNATGSARSGAYISVPYAIPEGTPLAT